MTTPIPDILAQLDPYWDRIIRRPLSVKEIKDLEKAIGLPAPTPLREYLQTVGLFQDLTNWQASPIEVYESMDQITSARQFLCKHTKYQDFFPLGDDGAGNIYCLPTAGESLCRFHLVDHETGKVSKGKDFDVWLDGVVGKVLKGIRKRLPNEHKVWAVQFCFNNVSYEDLKALLGSVGKFKEIDSTWKNREKVDTVTSTDRQFELNGTRYQLRRLECADWKGPSHSFDMREKLATVTANSQIRHLTAKFRANCPGFRLVDYGPLDARQLDK